MIEMSSDSSRIDTGGGRTKPALRVVGGTEPANDGYSSEQVVNQLQLHLDAQLSLCDALESFADNLPENVSNDDCLVLAQSVYPAVHRAHQFEENVLFPVLKSMSDENEGISATLDRLHAEHWEDESYAEEIAQSLKDFAANRANIQADTLGYMVRGFFEGLRRHIAFEREHIMPMIGVRQ